MPAADSLTRMLARPIAHRGLHAGGGVGPLENTIAAALAAIDAGYGIECDVRVARDGTPIVFHDATLKRLAGRPDTVADLPIGALADVPLRGCGSIATLSAFLDAIAGRVALVVEVKTGAAPEGIGRVLDLVAGYDGAIVLESFDPLVLAHCRYAPCPVGLVGPGAGHVGDLPRCDFLSWDVADLAAVPSSLPLTSWTVRTPEQAAAARNAGAQIVFEGWRPEVRSR